MNFSFECSNTICESSGFWYLWEMGFLVIWPRLTWTIDKLRSMQGLDLQTVRSSSLSKLPFFMNLHLPPSPSVPLGMKMNLHLTPPLYSTNAIYLPWASKHFSTIYLLLLSQKVARIFFFSPFEHSSNVLAKPFYHLNPQGQFFHYLPTSRIKRLSFPIIVNIFDSIRSCFKNHIFKICNSLLINSNSVMSLTHTKPSQLLGATRQLLGYDFISYLFMILCIIYY